MSGSGFQWQTAYSRFPVGSLNKEWHPTSSITTVCRYSTHLRFCPRISLSIMVFINPSRRNMCTIHSSHLLSNIFYRLGSFLSSSYYIFIRYLCYIRNFNIHLEHHISNGLNLLHSIVPTVYVSDSYNNTLHTTVFIIFLLNFQLLLFIKIGVQ